MLRKIPNVWGVESSDGFSVIRRGSPLTQFHIEFSGGGRSLIYPLENLAPGSVQPVFTKQIGPWLPPYAAEPLEPAEQSRIAAQIVQAMQFLGDAFELA